jgi:hypothetical protein
LILCIKDNRYGLIGKVRPKSEFSDAACHDEDSINYGVNKQGNVFSKGIYQVGNNDVQETDTYIAVVEADSFPIPNQLKPGTQS